MPTITSSDIISYYASLAEFGRHRLFEGIRFDSGKGKFVKLPYPTGSHFDSRIGQFVKGEPEAIEIPEPDWENRHGQYSMVLKVVDPSRDLPVEKISDRNSKLMCNDDYYKESLHKLLAEHGY
jgi:hypothetical protein